jgi:fibronectin-binding autotransporter adhesin
MGKGRGRTKRVAATKWAKHLKHQQGGGPERFRFVSSRYAAHFAIALSSVLLAPYFASADTDVSWTHNGGGNWTTASDWSDDLAPNNGDPSGTNYAVDFPSTLTATATINLQNTTSTVDTVSVEAPGFTLNDTSGGTLSVENMDMNAGTFRLNSDSAVLEGNDDNAVFNFAAGSVANLNKGEIEDGTISGGGTINVGNVIASGVAIASGTTVNVSTNLDEISENNGTINLSNASLHLESWNGTGAITGSNSTVTLDGEFNYSQLQYLNMTGGTASLVGSMHLKTTDVFDPNAAAYAWSFDGGSIINGTISSTTAVNVNSLNLDDVTVASGTSVDVATGGLLYYTSDTNNGITNNGTINVTNSSQFEGTFMTNAGKISAGNAGTISLSSASNGGTVTATDGSSVGLGESFINTGSVNVSNGSLYLYGSPDIYNDPGDIWTNTGTIAATNSNVTFSLAENLDGLGMLNFAGSNVVLSGFIAMNSGETLDLDKYGGSWTLDGEFSVSPVLVGGTVHSSTPIYATQGELDGTSIAAGTTIILGTGSNLTLAGTMANNGAIQATNASLFFDGTITNNGSILLHNSTLTIYGSGFNAGEGTLGGSGTVTGNITFDADPSQLAFNIGGTTKGTTYDSLAVNGNVALAGDLDISFANGFQNSILSSEQFTVMTVASGDTMTGAFANVANGGWLATTDGYGEFQVNYGTGIYADEIVLSNYQSLPEPASLGMLAVAFAFLTKRRRS